MHTSFTSVSVIGLFQNAQHAALPVLSSIKKKNLGAIFLLIESLFTEFTVNFYVKFLIVF